ncbi:MAG: methionyl-tRNA formyltransferase [Gammaproteobacteria bacterium]
MRIIFAGTPVFAATILQALIDGSHEVIAVYTQPDKPAGRGQLLHASEVKQLAETYEILVFQPSSLKTQEVQNEIAAFNPDIMVVAVYGTLLPQAVLDIPKYGCLNVHASLLPRWRGAAPISRANAAGDEQTGITMMQMVAGLDAGPMWEKFPLTIAPTDTHESLSLRLAKLAAEQINSTLDKIVEGRLTAEPQDDTQSCYAAKLSKEEGLINWQLPANSIARNIRAFNPWPVAYTHLQNQLLRVWNAEVIDGTANPGQIVALSPAGVDIGTGAGILRLLEVQLAGKRPISTGELVKTKHPLFKMGEICN